MSQLAEIATNESRVNNFNDALSTAMSGVRAVLDQAGLKDWKAFLLVRLPGHVNGFTIVSNPVDESGFDLKLVNLHMAETESETQ